MTEPLLTTDLPGHTLLHRGKVRDIYHADADHLLIIASDRVSAFDVVLPTGIPEKGAILTQLSNFWFRHMAAQARNHLSDRPLADYIADPTWLARLAPRTVVAQRFKPLPIEAIVRGYLSGSGWRDYQATGKVCGISLPAGLQLAERLPEPIFTPSTKAAAGGHDENIHFDQAADLLGGELAERVRALCLAVYDEAVRYAAGRGVIIADTKLELAQAENGELVIIDELLTPDSSRFWPSEAYQPGSSPPSFDKQFIRDYLEQSAWDKRAPAPELPAAIVRQTRANYRQALHRLTQPAQEEF